MCEEPEKALRYAQKARQIEIQCVGPEANLSDLLVETEHWITKLDGGERVGADASGMHNTNNS